MKRILSILSLCALSFSLQAQDGTNAKRVYNPEVGSQNQQGTYILRNDDWDRRVLPHTPVKEEDVMWYKEYKSAINLKLKKNQPLFYPEFPTRYRKSFAQTIFDAALKDKTLRVYEDEYFETEMAVDKLQEKLYRIEMNEIVDFDTDEVTIRPDTIRVLSKDIIEVVVREERFFDKKRSVMDRRILGMALVALKQNKETLAWDKELLFWFYYPEARQMLANQKIYNVYNSFEEVTMDEFFLKGMYSSVFIKESNLQDRAIFDYNEGKLNRLIESERIKEELRNFEHDLWNY